MKVEGSSVLVTGASSGIGAALAPALAARGARVGIVARRRERLEEVLAGIGGEAAGHRLWVADLGDVEGAERLALEAWDAFGGGLDAVVHNAAQPKRKDVRDLSVAELERTMQVNFLSPARMTLALLPRMLERGSGTIVNVSSLAGRLGVEREAAYCASKFAFNGWSEALAVDLAGSGIEIRLVNPGAIDTEIWDTPEDDAPVYDGPKEPPSLVADGIVAALESDRFEHYLPDMQAIVEWKTANIDEYLAGVSTMGT